MTLAELTPFLSLMCYKTIQYNVLDAEYDLKKIIKEEISAYCFLFDQRFMMHAFTFRKVFFLRENPTLLNNTIVIYSTNNLLVEIHH